MYPNFIHKLAALSLNTLTIVQYRITYKTPETKNKKDEFYRGSYCSSDCSYQSITYRSKVVFDTVSRFIQHLIPPLHKENSFIIQLLHKRLTIWFVYG